MLGKRSVHTSVLFQLQSTDHIKIYTAVVFSDTPAIYAQVCPHAIDAIARRGNMKALLVVDVQKRSGRNEPSIRKNDFLTVVKDAIQTARRLITSS